MKEQDVLIQLKNATVSKKDAVILENISLSCFRGEKILLKGESGSGKSTLMKALLLFEHMQGTLTYDGETVEQNNLCSYRHEIGYMGQTTPHLDISVPEFLHLPYTFKFNKDRSPDEKKTKNYLNRLNFDGSIMEKRFVDLSGGEKQRLLMVQMLLLDKPVYFLDEVTSALDRKNIRAAVSLICEEPERTVIAISHNPEWEEARMRVITMDNGRIVADTPAGD